MPRSSGTCVYSVGGEEMGKREEGGDENGGGKWER